MVKQLRPAATLFIVLSLVTGVAYPYAVTGLADILFPHQAGGSLISRDGTVVGSELIGQAFAGPGYFHSRPSATTDADPADPTKTIPAPYNAASSGASNLAPSAKALAATVAERVAALTAANPEAGGPVPADLATASASGLDPHISPAAAEYQVTRVAKARQAEIGALRRLVAQHTESRMFRLLGEPTVHVLRLNLALDERWPMK